MEFTEATKYLSLLPVVTERLSLELCGPDWSAACYDAIVEDREHLARWMRWDPMTATRETTGNFQSAALERTLRGESLELVVKDKITGRFLGQIGVAEFRRAGEEAVVGYWVRASVAGKGIATEALGALHAFLIGTVGVKRIVALVLPGNDRSIRVLEKLGFRLEGTERMKQMGRCSGKEALVFSRG